jgi:hypothetical protein
MAGVLYGLRRARSKEQDKAVLPQGMKLNDKGKSKETGFAAHF